MSIAIKKTEAIEWRVILPAGMFLLAAAIAIFVGKFPIQCSIAVVFLFAGPHNWFEARYLLTRVPPRLGRLRGYFAVGVLGVLSLAVTHFGIASAVSAGVTQEQSRMLVAVWLSAFVSWIIFLIAIRCQRGPRRDWSLALPIGLFALAICWAFPMHALLSLVFLHPLIGFWVCEREIKQRRPKLLNAFRLSLFAVPLACLALAIQYARADHLVTDDPASRWIVGAVGAGQVKIVSSHFLVAVHALLETLHYFVWIVLIPLVSGKVWTTNWSDMPLTRKAGAQRQWVLGGLVFVAFAVVVLWGAFSLNYTVTRAVYFHVAMIHVLAEIPFLIRML